MGANIRLSILAFMGILSIYFYYVFYSFHNESKAYFLIYIIIAFCIYGVYKLFQSLSGEITTFKYSHILVFFFLQLFVVCCLFAGLSGINFVLGTVIFFKIVSFLILVSGLWLTIYSFGRTLLGYFDFFSIDNDAFKILSSIGIGFIVFMMFIFLVAAFGLYTPLGIGVCIAIMIAVSYKNICKTVSKIYSIQWSYNALEDKSGLRLIIDEMHFMVISLLLSVNFLSVFRAYPIGWDDLGAYMNVPKILSQKGELISIGKMYPWELYTGIGHVFSSQTFAFFLNSFSGVLLAIISYISLKAILKPSKTLFNVPLMGTMILLMMPMVVFQLAKDMKLDIALLSFSIIAFTLSFFYVEGDILKNYTPFKKRIYIFIIGLIVGLCFTIKVTSLLLLLSILALIFYKRGHLLGLFGYLGIFIGVFSFGNLWSKMNVIFPSDAKLFSILSIIFGLGMLYCYIHTGGKVSRLKQAFIESMVLIFGFIIAFLPWGIKNISEGLSENTMSVGTMIGGKGEHFIPEYLDIYTQEELEEINDTKLRLGMKSSGKTTNEDFGRYFGYEEGINNYLKLPWNLTFQVNQKGEFTEISFIFFALIPVMFLFLPFRKEAYKYPLVFVLFLLLLYYIPEIKYSSGTVETTGGISNIFSSAITGLFNHIHLPYGYGIILLFFVIPLLYFTRALNTENRMVKIFLTAYVFCVVYVFLWNISSFGVVWYGILMYFVFVLMIVLSILSAHDSTEENKNLSIYTTLGIIWVYVIMSVIPHAVLNIKNAGFLQYKLGEYTEQEALISTHPEYFPILLELNVSRDKQADLFKEYRNTLLEIVDDIPDSENLITTIQSVQNTTQLQRHMSELLKYDLGDTGIKIRELRGKLYDEIIYPNSEDKNSEKILRVGTFLKYYISENNSRLLEDSLVNTFDTYIYDNDSKVVKDRLDTIGVGYILLDLNAATIDQDPRKQLTQRYENLLSFTNHSDITLVETDSICLKVARDDYKQLGDNNIFLAIATLNHGDRLAKKVACIDRVAHLIQNKFVSPTSYPYLYRLTVVLERAGIDMENEVALKSTLSKYISQGYKALFKIN